MGFKMMQCDICGIEKDPAVFEKYPYPKEDGIIEDGRWNIVLKYGIWGVEEGI